MHYTAEYDDDGRKLSFSSRLVMNEILTLRSFLVLPFLLFILLSFLYSQYFAEPQRYLLKNFTLLPSPWCDVSTLNDLVLLSFSSLFLLRSVFSASSRFHVIDGLARCRSFPRNSRYSSSSFLLYSRLGCRHHRLTDLGQPLEKWDEYRKGKRMNEWMEDEGAEMANRHKTK